MFLKTESFEHSGVIATLSELSAPQRIKHLTLIKQQAEQAKLDSNQQVTVEGVIRTGAFVVAVSLWHNHPQKTKRPSMSKAVRQTEQGVFTTWPTGTISHAGSMVYRPSGMHGFVVNDALDRAEDSGPAESVSVGKCSTAS